MHSSNKQLYYLVLVFAAISCRQICNSSVASLLSDVDFSKENYSTIHKLSIFDQIKLYSPARGFIPKWAPYSLQSLNGIYDFCLDPQERGFRNWWHSADLSMSCQQENLYKMPVPSAFNDITSNATVKNYIGWFWYQTTIELYDEQHEVADGGPEPWTWYLQFDNVNYLALVWAQDMPKLCSANNTTLGPATFLGSHVGGHLPFKFPMNMPRGTGATRHRKVRLTVAVSNRLTEDTIPSGSMVNLTSVVGREFYKFQPDFDFFHFSGILGDVRLFKLPPIHIEQVNVLDRRPEELVYNVCLNREPPPRSIIALAHWKGQAWEVEVSRTALTASDRCFSLELHDTIKIQEGDWSLSEGNVSMFNRFYELSIKLVDTNERVLDLYELRVFQARRKVEFVDSRGLLVGGQPRQLQGFGMHHEQLFSGRTMSQAAILKDIYLLKQMGVNVIRSSHYPYSSAYLDACDEHGILVIAECPAVGLRSFSQVKLQLHKQMLLEMMQRDQHHPSVLMWSVANEPQSQLPASQAYFESLLSYARSELAAFTTKAGRPLTAAIAQDASADRIGCGLDVIMINRYYGWYDFAGVVEAVRSPMLASLAGWASKCPGKALLVSEFGADTLGGLHSNEATIFSEEYQRQLLEEHELLFNDIFGSPSLKNRTNFVGSMVWNFADFSTHPSLLRPGGNRKGVFSREREPKLAAHLLKELYLARLGKSKGGGGSKSGNRCLRQAIHPKQQVCT